jgi:hypothetical protein
MDKAPKHNPVRGSKLVRLLSEYKMTNIEVSHNNFAERLGLLVDLSDSVTLSESLRAIPKMSHKLADGKVDAKCDHLVQEFLTQRSIIFKSILKSFDLNAVFIPFKLPAPTSNTSNKEAINFDPYKRFYLLHQSELDFKTEKLRTFVRKIITDRSLNLAQLAELDKTFSQSMMVHTRKRFSIVPKLLEIRFKQLFSEYRETFKDSDFVDKPLFWINETGWLTQFYSEMQQLLLAEFDVRLQPIIGLVEAYNEEM